MHVNRILKSMSKVKAHFVKLRCRFLRFHRIDTIFSGYFLKIMCDIFRTFSLKKNEIIIEKMKMKILRLTDIFFFARKKTHCYNP